MNKQQPAATNRFALIFLIATLTALPFSYYPLITFGSIAGAHIDGSLLYLLTGLTVLASTPILWRHRRLLRRSSPMLIWLLLFIMFCGLSIAWSDNRVRGTLTVSFLLLIVGLACAIVVTLPDLKRRSNVAFRLVAVSVGVSIAWSLWQLYADAFGVDSSLTLLPTAYQSSAFGVARPTAFALEPQFFASLLLIPFFWLCWRFLKSNDAQPLRYYAAGIILVVSILVTTLSRGALYATFIGLVILLILEHSDALRRWLMLGLTLLVGLVASGLIIYSAASINQRDTISGYSSVSRAINHLSLGAVSLPDKTPPNPSQKPASPKKLGYIASSTDSRLSMSEQAISLWQTNPQTILLGTGAGSFGATLHAKDPSYSTNSVVNNYYLETLAETGIIGLGALLMFLGSLMYQLFRHRQTLLLTLLISLLLQLCFFSGNANIIHVWVIIGLAIGVIVSQPKKTPRLVQ